MSPPSASATGPGRLTSMLMAAGGAVLVLAGARAVNGILGPTLLGFVIVVAVYPLASWLRRHAVPGWVALIVTMLVSYGIIVLLVGGTLLTLAVFVGLLPQYSAQFDTLVGQITDWLGGLGITTADLESAVSSISPEQVTAALRSAGGSVGSLLSALLLMLTVTFFLVLDSAGLPHRIAAIGRDRPELATGLRQFAHGTRIYLVVATVFGGVVAVADVVLLYAVGIPYPWVWGLLAFLTGYIPNIGFLVGLLPVSILAVLQGGWTDLVVVVAGYCVVNFVLQSLVQPKFVGDSVGLATTVSFLSLAFWTFVLGPLGAILAVPATLLAKALLIDSDPSKAWTAALIAGTPRERTEGRVEALDEFGRPEPEEELA